MTFTQMFEASDKLADTIYTATSLGSLGAEIAARATREAFVVIDRNDLPEIVPDADPATGLRATVAYDAEGHVAEAYITPASGRTPCNTPEWHEAKAKVHLAAAEYLRANPPVLVDEKAVGELAQWMGALYAGVATNEVQWNARLNLARRLVADGWKREAKP